MQKYVWTKELSVDVDEIDEQHKHFFEIVNSVMAVADQEAPKAQDLRLEIVRLKNYSIYHFMTEEKIFYKYDYPDTKVHVAAHNAYRKGIEQLILKLSVQGVDIKELAEETAKFGGDWLTNHIKVMDHKYIGFMHKIGLH